VAIGVGVGGRLAGDGYVGSSVVSMSIKEYDHEGGTNMMISCYETTRKVEELNVEETSNAKYVSRKRQQR
jgi:hypothetical protein